jgi:hypothetical protein
MQGYRYGDRKLRHFPIPKYQLPEFSVKQVAESFAEMGVKERSVVSERVEGRREDYKKKKNCYKAGCW